jgi:hypothetical protein
MVCVAGTSGRLADKFTKVSLGNAHSARPRAHTISRRQLRVISAAEGAGSSGDDLEPDWEQEMSIFKKRTLAPSQMEALRKLEEEKVDVGRVSRCSCHIILL